MSMFGSLRIFKSYAQCNKAISGLLHFSSIRINSINQFREEESCRKEEESCREEEEES